MIGWFGKCEKFFNNIIDLNNLELIINLLRKENDIYCKYVVSLYEEYKEFLKKNQAVLIKSYLHSTFGSNLIDCNNHLPKMAKVILSPSHDNTYYIIKQLNTQRQNDVLVICFDMHSDTYDYNDVLWKGNVFSKLLHEKYINNLMVIGVPTDKISDIYLDMNEDIRDQVILSNSINIEKYIKLCSPSNIFISIDIDAFNTRAKKMTALEYCPATILSNVSKIDMSKDILLVEEIKKAIFVKNSLGFANLYKSGENNLSLLKLFAVISNIKTICDRYGIMLGFNNKNHIIADITELSGYDYGCVTSNFVIKIINKLIQIGGDGSEKSFFGKN